MRRSLFATTALLFAATPLLAQEHAAEEGGGLLSINPGLTIWTIVIFLIVLAILTKAAYPKILGAVEARERHIAELTEAAERDRAEAAALADENRRGGWSEDDDQPEGDPCRRCGSRGSRELFHVQRALPFVGSSPSHR